MLASSLSGRKAANLGSRRESSQGGLKEPRLITQSRLKEVINYDPETGIFTWKVSFGTGSAHVGGVAGSVQRGYRSIKIDRKAYRAANLAWLYMTGEFPPRLVDHKNTIRDDNKFANLRLATNSENQFNLNKMSHNTSGFKGVHRLKDTGRWQARICANYKRRVLGCFDTPQEAHEAYCKAAAELHGEFARVA